MKIRCSFFSHSVRNLSALVDGKRLETSASLFTIGGAIFVTTRYVKALAYRDEIVVWGS